MTSRRKFRLKRTDAAALAAAVVLAVISLLPASWMPVTVFALVGGDKAAHILAYMVLGTFALYARRRFSTVFLTMISLLYFGGLIELLQEDFGRTSDIADLAANGVGLGLAGITVAVWKTMRALPRTNPAHRA
ncbi:MAG: VanZ family protein [Pseudomonadota bacterium]